MVTQIGVVCFDLSIAKSQHFLPFSIHFTVLREPMLAFWKLYVISDNSFQKKRCPFLYPAGKKPTSAGFGVRRGYLQRDLFAAACLKFKRTGRDITAGALAVLKILCGRVGWLWQSHGNYLHEAVRARQLVKGRTVGYGHERRAAGRSEHAAQHLAELSVLVGLDGCRTSHRKYRRCPPSRSPLQRYARSQPQSPSC